MIDFNKLIEWTSSENKIDKSLRDYQQTNKQKIYESLTTHKSVMLQMPTGTGKTRLFVSVMRDLLDFGISQKKAIKMLVLVHRVELIDQISETLSKYKMAHGVILSGIKEDRSKSIQVASVPTLSRRLDNWSSKDFDLIIVDESHHIPAQSYRKIVEEYSNAQLIGVTATPCRLSGEGFSDIFEDLILSPSIREFIERGYLSDYDYYSVKSHSAIVRQIAGIKKFSQGDYAESELIRVCDNEGIRAQVVETYLKYAKGKKGIVYAINRQHNANLCKAFCEAGVKAVAIDSNTNPAERDMKVRQFKNGEIDVICNVNIFTEGFDCPDIEFVQLARPTKSLSLFLQQVGRGLRISEGKKKSMFLDNVGLYGKFGTPSRHRDWWIYFEGKEEQDSGINRLPKGGRQGTSRDANDYSEGKENVFLIESSDDSAYYQIRIQEIEQLVIEYLKSIRPIVEKNRREMEKLTNGWLKLEFDYTDQNVVPYLLMPHHKGIINPFIRMVIGNITFSFLNEKSEQMKERLCKNEDELFVRINDYVYQEFKQSSIASIKRAYDRLGLSFDEMPGILMAMFGKMVDAQYVPKYCSISLSLYDAFRSLLRFLSVYDTEGKTKERPEAASDYNLFDNVLRYFEAFLYLMPGVTEEELDKEWDNSIHKAQFFLYGTETSKDSIGTNNISVRWSLRVIAEDLAKYVVDDQIQECLSKSLDVVFITTEKTSDTVIDMLTSLGALVYIVEYDANTFIESVIYDSRCAIIAGSRILDQRLIASYNTKFNKLKESGTLYSSPMSVAWNLRNKEIRYSYAKYLLEDKRLVWNGNDAIDVFRPWEFDETLGIIEKRYIDDDKPSMIEMSFRRTANEINRELQRLKFETASMNFEYRLAKF